MTNEKLNYNNHI